MTVWSSPQYGVGAILGMLSSGMIKDSTARAYLPVLLPVMVLAAVGIVVSLLWLRPVKA